MTRAPEAGKLAPRDASEYPPGGLVGDAGGDVAAGLGRMSPLACEAYTSFPDTSCVEEGLSYRSTAPEQGPAGVEERAGRPPTQKGSPRG